MKFELVRNLKGDEILAETLYANGKVLLSAGTKLSKGHINILKQNMVFTLRLVDNEPKGTGESLQGFNNVSKDSVGNDEKRHAVSEENNKEKIFTGESKIVQLKQTTLEKMPEVFDGLLLGNEESVNKSMGIVKDLVNSIIDERDLNTNLYEISEYDDYTYSHSVNTGIMAIILGTAFHMSKSELHNLGVAAMLHDIGKIRVPFDTINKNGPLTQSELEEVKLHPIHGHSIISEAGIDNDEILNTVLQHHERIDGSGYPLGLKGNEISLYAKIVAVCDVFTAISANRSYRNRFNPNEAYEYVIAGIGVLFDQEVVKRFKSIFSIYPIGCTIVISDGARGQVIRQNKGFPDRPVINVNYNIIKNAAVEPYEVDLLQKTTLIIIEVI